MGDNENPEKRDNVSKESDDSKNPLTSLLNKEMTRRQAISTAGKIAVAVGVTAVVAGGGTALYFSNFQPSGTKKTVKIGGTLPLTGPGASDGQNLLRGVRMAVDHVNSQGGVLGAPLQLVVYDDALDPTQVTPLYEKLITQDNVDILLGPLGAGTGLPAAQTAAKHNKLLIAPFTAASSINNAYGGTSFYSIDGASLGSGAWGYAMVDFLDHFDTWNTKSNFQKPTKLAVLDLNTTFGQDSWKALESIYRQKGFNVVYHEFVDTSTSDYTPILLKAQAANPDVIMGLFFAFMSETMQPLFVQKNVQLAFEYQMELNSYAQKADIGSAVDGVTFLDSFPDSYHGGDADYFRTAFQQLFGYQPEYLEPAGYAGPELIAKVVNSTGSLDSGKLISALKSQVWETCYTTCKFDDHGYNLNFNPGVGQWINGKIQTIWPISLQTAKPVYPYTPSH